MPKSTLTIPNIFKAIYNAEDDSQIMKYENMMICMFISPILLIGSVANIVVRVLIFHRNLMMMLVDSIILMLFGISFEVLLRLDFKMKAKAKAHIISALFAVFFVYVVIRYYVLIGPSIWVFGLMPIMLSMVHSTRILWTYTGFSLFFSWIYITFVAAKSDGLTNYYYVLLFVFFAMLFFASLAVSHISVKRIRKIREQLKEVKTQAEDNKRLALCDQLTGLPNRTLFYERLGQKLNEANGSRVHVLFLDLDMFKMINDTIGHTQGDELLKQVGNRLSNTIGKDDMVARIGGDEFLIMHQEGSSGDSAAELAALILKQISSPFFISQQQLYVTCSIGISQYPSDGKDVETMIKHADIALYKAKENGKDRFCFYSENLNRIVQHEMNMINELRHALVQQEFELYYQPQMNAKTREVIGYEALIRWNHPTMGLVSPNAFIPLAEKSDLIQTIGEWVLRTACEQNKAWQTEGLASVPVAVNLSVKELCSGSLTKRVQDVLHETGLDPRCLVIEITERIPIKDIHKIKDELAGLKQLGVNIAIDDFGTGYSAFQYLKEFPVDSIKIPIEFVRGIDKNKTDESIIIAMLALAAAFELEVIAEGVETKSQLDFLSARSCNHIQGYYFCKPMNAIDIAAFVSSKAPLGRKHRV